MDNHGLCEIAKAIVKAARICVYAFVFRGNGPEYTRRFRIFLQEIGEVD